MFAISETPVTFGAVNVLGISKLVPLSRIILVVDTLALVLVSCNNTPFSSLSSKTMTSSFSLIKDESVSFSNKSFSPAFVAEPSVPSNNIT